MKTILITAYAVNPYKGSEDAMGWHMILQAARYNKVIAVTRRNNRVQIEKYYRLHMADNPLLRRIAFLYFDWPQWTLWWKKGPLLSMIYYYGWQLSLALWLKKKKLQADIVHNLNFHNDWSPTFLWMLKKPLVWGQVGHHPKIPRRFILPLYGWKAYTADRALWIVKNICWHFDPFLYISKQKAASVICMNSEAVKKLRLKQNFLIHPSVAAVENITGATKSPVFTVISVGRFVPLKGFDLTIKSFATFYHKLPAADKPVIKLILVGSGPCKRILQQLANKGGVQHAVEFIDWMPHEEVMQLYKSASVFLFPSHEGAGMVVPEAMSAALPVVCLKNCGPGEAVHPQSKLVVPYKRYNATISLLALKLKHLFYSPEFYERESALSYERYQQLFRWDVRGDMLNKLYDSVCRKEYSAPINHAVSYA